YVLIVFVLVGGASPCAGSLEQKQWGDWKPVYDEYEKWTSTSAAAVCRQLDCGSLVSLRRTLVPVYIPTFSTYLKPLQLEINCHQCHNLQMQIQLQVETYKRQNKANAGTLCSSSTSATSTDSVRLVSGTPCSGRLEVKSNQSWSSVCEDDFGQQDAEVVCRELGCGAPERLQGALHGEVEVLVRAKVFQCQGLESTLQDCGGFSSARNPCPPYQDVNLTYSVRLTGKNNRCAGTLEIKNQGEWRPVNKQGSSWDHQSAAAVCAELECGPVVFTEQTYNSSYGRHVCQWHLLHGYLRPCPNDTMCQKHGSHSYCFSLQDVRLVGGASPCAGSLEQKHQGDWKPVYDEYKEWTSTSAAAVCRQLNCGLLVSLQRTLVPVYIPQLRPYRNSHQLEINCSGPSHFLFFPSSSSTSAASTDSVRLVSGTPCSGRLEVKSNQSWSSVCEDDFGQQDAEVVCRELGCGAPERLQGALHGEVEAPVRAKVFQCQGLESTLQDCGGFSSARNPCPPYQDVNLTCSGMRGTAAFI
uniref:SRCR domain-containing protein n=1 Tax=Mola mola TaxID=94237 RepID=A0A3Q3WU44_MOLML